MSLRDVERVLEVMSWFYKQEEETTLFTLMDDHSSGADTDSEEEVDSDSEGEREQRDIEV